MIKTLPDENDARQYIPGVCNIGKKEIQQRRNGIFFALALLIVVVVLLEVFKADKLWRLIVFLPATSLAVSFQQWYFKFCVGFGMKGVFNFGDLGKTFTVEQKEYFQKDRAKATKMIVAGIVFGLVLTLIYYFL